MGRWTERELEHRVRMCADCPTCGVLAPQRCWYDNAGRRSVWSHTSRYLIAVAAGEVPPIPGFSIEGGAVSLVNRITRVVVPTETWTEIPGYSCEVWQASGIPQPVAVLDDRIVWMGEHMPARDLTTVMLRPIGGVYPPGWAAPLYGVWWVAEPPQAAA